jgi:hypothetical protein
MFTGVAFLQKKDTGVTPPLDIWSSNPKIAVSLRKLITSYSGNCIRVLRTSDNATQDIGFTSNGELDTASLLSFIGASSGRVVRWYDQIASVEAYLSNAPASDGLTGGNFTGGSTGPLIVDSGTLITRNGKPALLFERSGNCPMGYQTDFKKNLQKYTIISVSNRDLDPATSQENDVYFGSLITGGGSIAFLSHGAATGGATGVFAGGRRISSDTFSGIGISSHTPPNNPIINFVYGDHGSRLIQLTRNNESLAQNTTFATSGTTTDTNIYFNIGTNNRGNTSTVRLNGTIQEIIGWNADYNVDKTDIINNLNSYWGVF